MRLLPYVAPTTDWIRLQRRFPVTILLDEPPPDMKLYMGADGTIAAAAAGLILTPWLAYDHVAGSLFLFCIGTLGALGFMLSAYGYAWLFTGITVNLIVLSSLENPLLALAPPAAGRPGRSSTPAHPRSDGR